MASPSGDDSGGDPRVPIPNTTVKPSSADGTWTEGSRESRTLPGGPLIPSGRTREADAEARVQKNGPLAQLVRAHP